MFRALYTAASGMQAQQTNLDTIANNLSNSSTAGFRSRRMQFQDLARLVPAKLLAVRQGAERFAFLIEVFMVFFMAINRQAELRPQTGRNEDAGNVAAGA